MTTLAEFLTARYDEHEADAQAATAGPWDARKVSGPGFGYDQSEVVQPSDVPDRGFYALGMDALYGPDARHIARHDPAYVLADIASKRAIVRLHTGAHECRDVLEYPDGYVRDGEWCTTLRLLAVPFAAHPDYDERWRP